MREVTEYSESFLFRSSLVFRHQGRCCVAQAFSLALVTGKAVSEPLIGTHGVLLAAVLEQLRQSEFRSQ
jgi:hypothetical protein